ncbi:endocuticle structural glycoprotein SgAbd-5-like [Vanessa cardui]|uniref:endocuticle structural glycoprotein SgAbd-5-like n=1 Tax=Vanessa cardui TaxID=171605 RepID=UPI001F13914F|nr:endocuticle structural glycoprotein SgAbd-5-like [Vanessa cardui]
MIALRLCILASALAMLAAQDASTPPPAHIITEKTIVRQNGYDFEFQTSDGVSRKEEAELITVGDHQGIGVKGTYSYVAPDGLQYVVSYTADDKGFKPTIRIGSSNDQ